MRLRHMARLGFSPRVVLDVGAARGEWSRLAASIWPQATIIGIEPNEREVPLLERAKAELPRFDYWRGFLGRQSRTVQYADKNTQTSVLDADSNQSGQQSADMMRLDDLLAQRQWPMPDFIKLDVQGYELEVLSGGEKAMAGCQAILTEVSFYRFFGQVPTADEVIEFLKARGFAWYDVMGIMRRGSDDALAQMDFMFLKTDHPLRADNTI